VRDGVFNLATWFARAAGGGLANCRSGRDRTTTPGALRQLDGLERLIRYSEANTSIIAGERYHFDYPRLLTDLAQVRTGIHAYLTPSRAQPRDVTELSGDYRNEAQQP